MSIEMAVANGAGRRIRAAVEAGEARNAVGYAGDLDRCVFGVMGIPLDVVSLEQAVATVHQAAAARSSFLLSTPNINFLMLSRKDAQFRESLLRSDMCPADGMALVWLARLLGVPIKDRVAGSDLFDVLRSSTGSPLRVFLFGGGGEVADAVRTRLNSREQGLICVGAMNPGFGNVEDLSDPKILSAIDSAKADMLAVFLSAKKAQEWLVHNHDQLQTPVRGQFGATINMQAGTVKRAPKWIQNVGAEWLWRVKEEPYLWRRYMQDGLGLLKIVAVSALPLALLRFVSKTPRDLTVDVQELPTASVVNLSGQANVRNVDLLIRAIENLMPFEKDVRLDLSGLTYVDARFFGLILMLRKILVRAGRRLFISGSTRRMILLFKLNGFAFLMSNEE